PWVELPDRAGFLARCGSLSQQEQLCLQPRYQAQKHDVCDPLLEGVKKRNLLYEPLGRPAPSVSEPPPEMPQWDSAAALPPVLDAASRAGIGGIERGGSPPGIDGFRQLAHRFQRIAELEPESLVVGIARRRLAEKLHGSRRVVPLALVGQAAIEIQLGGVR